MTAESLDATWEDDVYGRGRHLNRYPWDVVVSFVHRYRDPARAPQDTRLLEIGCGAGNNLWFAAREGFDVAGIDGSRSAIAYARRRFEEDGLAGDLRVGDFTALPYPDETFDLVIDRAALTYAPEIVALTAVAEVSRTLRPGGRFLFNAYSKSHASAVGAHLRADGLHEGMTVGSLAGSARVRFYDRADVDRLLDGWVILSRQHVVAVESVPEESAHAEWRVVAEKPAD